MRPKTESFQFKGKALVLRLFRLKRLPPAFYGTQILSEQGFPVLVVEFGHVSESETTRTKPLPTRRLQNRWARWVLTRWQPVLILAGTLLQLCYGFLTEGRPRLLVAHGLQEQLLARILASLFRIPYVVNVHEAYELSDLSGLNRWLFRLEGWGLRRALFLMFPERQRARIYKDRYGLTNKDFFVPNCPRRRSRQQHRDLREECGLSKTDRVALYLGGVAPSNALEELISAVAALPQLHLWVVGWAEPSYQKKLSQLAHSCGVEKRVYFWGPTEDRWLFLDQVDISYCVYRPQWLRLRHAATASNKLMESFASGVPVLTLQSGGFKEIVETYDVGVCIDSISVATIRAGLQALFHDEALLRQRSQNAIRLHTQTFHYEKHFSQVLPSFRKVLRKVLTSHREI